jgi:hypothetical protein
VAGRPISPRGGSANPRPVGLGGGGGGGGGKGWFSTIIHPINRPLSIEENVCLGFRRKISS